MKRRTIFLYILLLTYCLSAPTAQDGSGEKATALERRIEAYRKYMRQGTMELPQSSRTHASDTKKTNPRLPEAEITQTRYTRAPIGLQEELKEMEEIKTSYFKYLYKVYQNTGITWKHFVHFLKVKNDLSLKEFKIRSQQLKVHLLKSRESVDQVKIQLLRALEFHQEIHETLQDNTVTFMGSVYYSKLMQSLSLVAFQKDLYSLLLNQVIDREQYTLNQGIDRVVSWIEKTQELNEKNWDKSYKSILLKDCSGLTHDIKNDIQLTLQDMQNLKKYFVYSEAQLLSSYKEGITPPQTGTNTNLEHHKFSKLEEGLQQKIRNFIAREQVDRAILLTRLKNNQKATLPALQLPALSSHLFNKNSVQPAKSKSESGNIEKPDWL